MSSGGGYNALLTMRAGSQMDFLETGEFAQAKGDEESQRDTDHTCEAVQLTFYYINKSRNSLHLPNSNYISVRNNYEFMY